jgi:hypothetical protein
VTMEGERKEDMEIIKKGGKRKQVSKGKER